MDKITSWFEIETEMNKSRFDTQNCGHFTREKAQWQKMLQLQPYLTMIQDFDLII